MSGSIELLFMGVDLRVSSVWPIKLVTTVRAIRVIRVERKTSRRVIRTLSKELWCDKNRSWSWSRFVASIAYYSSAKASKLHARFDETPSRTASEGYKL